ncbi:hypothetical protein HPP92_016997 [Vanilla planifolia]|uniref:Uncharacterized protein n=1 Tax=Vanilla planifolia TaxID=51239 RepID=A0A835QJY7_VANPL|nr:hypothetical protein HPP92_016997 [Vanilla planifolia]
MDTIHGLPPEERLTAVGTLSLSSNDPQIVGYASANRSEEDALCWVLAIILVAAEFNPSRKELPPESSSSVQVGSGP